MSVTTHSTVYVWQHKAQYPDLRVCVWQLKLKVWYTGFTLVCLWQHTSEHCCQDVLMTTQRRVGCINSMATYSTSRATTSLSTAPHSTFNCHKYVCGNTHHTCIHNEASVPSLATVHCRHYYKKEISKNLYYIIKSRKTMLNCKNHYSTAVAPGILQVQYL